MFTFIASGEPNASPSFLSLDGQKVYEIERANLLGKPATFVWRFTIEPTVLPHLDPTDMKNDEGTVGPFTLKANPTLCLFQHIYASHGYGASFDEDNLEEGPEVSQPLMVAVIETANYGPAMITFHGSQVSDTVLFQRYGFFFNDSSRSIVFVGPDEKRYTWDDTGRGLQLNTVIIGVGSESGLRRRLVAEWEGPGPSQPPQLVVGPLGAHMVDFIVMTWTYAYEKLVGSA